MKKIFIDPGHGGLDSGAIGNGLQEKDITLEIALQLKQILIHNYSGHTVKLSRETDRTVSLRERTTMANHWQADYLISIHINAGGGTGFESFIYNNAQHRRRDTQSLQSKVHNEIIKEIDLINRGRKEANFHMLRESLMPALLTENGFIDNKQDARLLKNKQFIEKVAIGHAKGLAVALNLAKRPTAAAHLTKHAVKKGETLWSIAKDYKTTVQRLLQANNNIDPRQLPIGYKLIISKPSTTEHTIQKGDTLWSLAVAHRTTVRELQLLNPKADPKRLVIGDKIKLP